MKKMLAILVLAVSLCALPVSGRASNLEIVAEDSLWGALIGTLGGTAMLAFRDHPGDHLELIYRGAAVGLLGGIAFGFYEISPTFIAYRDPITHETTYAAGLRISLK